MIAALSAALRAAGTIFRSLGARFFGSFKGKGKFKVNAKNLRKFKQDIAREIDAIADEGMDYNRRIARETFSNVVKATPVDTGFLSSMWKHSLNRKPPFDNINNPRSGTHSPATTPSFATFSKGDILYIYNPTVYAKRIEDGWSAQAPRNYSRKIISRGDRKLQGLYNRIK